MTNLTTLADRIEAGTVERELDLLGDAYDLLGPILKWRLWRAHHFADMLNCRAYQTAAAMLADPAWMQRGGNDGAGPDPANWFWEVITDAPTCARVRAVAATEALARVACYLRAHASIKDNSHDCREEDGI